jgi:two-component system sensor histidine kinase YesM
MTVRRRFICLFLVLSFLPVILAECFTYFFYGPSLSNKVQQLLGYSLRQKGENIRLVLGAETELVYKIAIDPEIVQLVRKINAPDAGFTSLLKSQLIDAFSRLSLFDNNLAGLGVLTSNGWFVEYDKYYMVREDQDFDKYFPLDRIKQEVDKVGGLRFFPTILFRDLAGLPHNLFLAAFPLIDSESQTRLGYLFLLIQEAPIKEILNPKASDRSGFLSRSLLLTDEGVPISLPNGLSLDQVKLVPDSQGKDVIKLAARLPEFRGKKCGVILDPGPYPHWMLATLYDETSVESDRYWVAIYTLLIGLALFGISATGAFLVYRNVFRSFASLMNRVTVVDSGLRLEHTDKGGDEFEVLGEAWEDLRKRIAYLVDEVNERNARMLELSEARRLAEIRMIEAQVNPHFLYNTLNTLNWMAIERGQDELSKACSDLAKILRYSISQIDATATLKEERDWLERYLALQKLRFRDNLDYEIRCAASPAFRIYKLLLLPFVENSVVHGLDPNRKGGRIEVDFTAMPESQLRITIRDNGKGFVVDDVQHRSEESTIGISNVQYRLESYYGDRASLHYSSHPGQGTVVELIVPEAKA